MLTQPTLDTLNRLKLHGIALGLSEQMTNSGVQQLAFEERIALLLDIWRHGMPPDMNALSLMIVALVRLGMLIRGSPFAL